MLSAQTPALRTAIDAVLQQDGSLAARDLAAVHDRFFPLAHADQENLTETIGRAVEQVQHGIDGAARAVAENIRSALSKSEVVKRSDGEGIGRVTRSIGVAEYELSDTEESFVQRADRHLYAAKRRGRNRVAIEAEAADWSVPMIDANGPGP